MAREKDESESDRRNSSRELDMQKLIETSADRQIRECLDKKNSFSMIAGAGSGKTTSLVTALQYLRAIEGNNLRRTDRRIVCATYTNRAVDVISSRLDQDGLFLVCTLHTFLWSQIKRYNSDIQEALMKHVIPAHIDKKKAEDNGGHSQRAIAARKKIEQLEADLKTLHSVDTFEYNDSKFSNYSEGQINHDDMIEISAYLISNKEILRRIIGQKYPYIFVDEAQDTFISVVEALNKLCEGTGVPIVGYFGDPMQQIYDDRAGDFFGPTNSTKITKVENFRCSVKVIDLLNSFRKDVEQVPAGENKKVAGSVLLTLVRAEIPEGPRKTYTEEQLLRASERYNEALKDWGWENNENLKSLFLARQMIARRMGFIELHRLFTGTFASAKAQEDYESGKHFLIKPFLKVICPLIHAKKASNSRQLLDTLRKSSPAFNPRGVNARKTLKDIKALATELSDELLRLWETGTSKDILNYCSENGLCDISERLSEHMKRPKREEEYDSEQHSNEKSDWLADRFFEMSTAEIELYVAFIEENTPFSTQHGVKGEEYIDVIVIFDDVEAAWTKYSFSKTLLPDLSGSPTSGQYERSSKLTYVCFSRAIENLRILLFTQNPEDAKAELISKGLFKEAQISIAN